MLHPKDKLLGCAHRISSTYPSQNHTDCSRNLQGNCYAMSIGQHHVSFPGSHLPKHYTDFVKMSGIFPMTVCTGNKYLQFSWQGLVEIPYIVVQTILFTLITYFMMDFERTVGMIFFTWILWFFYILYFKFR